MLKYFLYLFIMTRLAKTSEFENSKCQHECVANGASLTEEKVCQTKGQCNLENNVRDRKKTRVSYHSIYVEQEKK